MTWTRILYGFIFRLKSFVETLWKLWNLTSLSSLNYSWYQGMGGEGGSLNPSYDGDETRSHPRRYSRESFEVYTKDVNLCTHGRSSDSFDFLDLLWRSFYLHGYKTNWPWNSQQLLLSMYGSIPMFSLPWVCSGKIQVESDILKDPPVMCRLALPDTPHLVLTIPEHPSTTRNSGFVI